MGIKNFGFESVETYLQKGIYYIPDYQREYSWSKEEQVDDFWADLEAAVNDQRDNHFFGQVVIHESLAENKKYIIDGQQRTTTSIIFLAVLRDLFEEIYQKSGNTSAQYKYEDIKLKFIGRYSDEENELRLTLGRIDEKFFRDNIQIRKPDKDIDPIEPSHKKIKEAYEYLESKLREKLMEQPDYKSQYKLLLEYYNKFLKGFKLMYVETDEINEAFIIFETLNARGKDLETSDLLKNHLFRTAGKSIDKVKETWMRTVENLDNIDITKFLRHYWNSKYSFTREKDLYKKIRNLINSPKKCEEFVENFYEISDVYKALVNPAEETYFTKQEIGNKLKNLKILSASSFYPIILALVNNGFEENDIEIVVTSIETLIFRNCVVAGKVANKYELLFARIAHNISEKAFTTVEEIIAEIKKETLSDDEFESAFKIFSIKSVPVAKYVLREINNFIDPEVHVITDNYKIHLEHIMPKKKGQWDVSDDIHNKYISRLGNLTLLANEYNKSLQNKTFTDKRQMYFNSNLAINRALSEYEEWNQFTIEDRQMKLFEIAKKRWKIN